MPATVSPGEKYRTVIVLFDREGARTPALTQAGAAVLAKAKVVAVGIDDLRASVRSGPTRLRARRRRG